MAFHSKKVGSNQLSAAGIKIGHSESNENDEVNSFYSQMISSSQNITTVSYGSSSHPGTFMFDITEDHRFGSSFIPLYRLVHSESVSNALKYWTGRWNIMPKSLIQFMNVNDITEIPYGKNITLYHNNYPYTVFINNQGKISIPNCQMIFTHYYRYYKCQMLSKNYQNVYSYEVILDPINMEINGLPVGPFVKTWKNHLGHKKQGYGYEQITLEFNLSPFWEFAQPITNAFFAGNGINFMKLINNDSHSFKIEFNNPPEMGGSSWEDGPHFVYLQQKIKVRLVL